MSVTLAHDSDYCSSTQDMGYPNDHRDLWAIRNVGIIIMKIKRIQLLTE